MLYGFPKNQISNTLRQQTDPETFNSFPDAPRWAGRRRVVSLPDAT
jgi:hypothetical protein